jgi:adenosylmethionine-8-amino-7-oxononanoate aminotransferase
MCLSRRLYNGSLPLATDDIFRAFPEDFAEFKTFSHGHSCAGNPLACSAAPLHWVCLKKTLFYRRYFRKVIYLIIS